MGTCWVYWFPRLVSNRNSWVAIGVIITLCIFFKIPIYFISSDFTVYYFNIILLFVYICWACSLLFILKIRSRVIQQWIDLFVLKSKLNIFWLHVEICLPNLVDFTFFELNDLVTMHVLSFLTTYQYKLQLKVDTRYVGHICCVFAYGKLSDWF